MKVTMAWADIRPNAKKNVLNVLDRGWLSYSLYQPRFEKQVAEMHGAKHGIFVNSGTDALKISVATLKEIYKWPDGSEVLVPAVTFVATVNAVLQNSLKPVFVDVDCLTANIRLSQVADQLTNLTRAILAVHLFGLSADMSACTAIARQNKLQVIEDSCETFGVHRVAGAMACFSFYVSHHVSTGVGGMILTNSARYERLARSLMNHGRIDDGSHFKFGRVGYSSRATEMEAALGVAALEHFQEDLTRRKQLAWQYGLRLGGFSAHLEGPPHHSNHSWMFYPVLLRKGLRDKVLAYLRRNGIESREAMPLINQPVFKKLYKRGSCPNAENWTDNGLLLPLHPLLKERDIDFVCDTLKRFFR